jgi:hypothetical protein
MSEPDYTGHDASVSINKSNTVGIQLLDYTTNETRTTYFSPELLREWAEFVADVYGDESAVEVVHTPGRPLAARVTGADGFDESVGVTVAPRVHQEADTDE